ncbi:hypothetical protein Tco_0227668 [Tanacetum coccineum]
MLAVAHGTRRGPGRVKIWEEEEHQKRRRRTQKEEEIREVMIIKEDENDRRLTYPYEEVDPLNPSPPASESEPEDVIEVEDMVESEDDIIPNSVHEVGNEVHFSVEQGATAMEKLVEKLGNAEEKAECKKLKKGFVFEERPNEAIDVLVEDKKSPSSEPRGSPHDA